MLHSFYEDLTDDELLHRIQCGLTDEAHQIALSEVRRRDLRVPLEAATVESEPEPYLGDMVILEHSLTPTEAQMLSSCLAAAGIRAVADDTNLVQANSLWSIALGGAKVRVPQTQLADAREVLAAFRRGDFALEDDFDVGESPA